MPQTNKKSNYIIFILAIVFLSIGIRPKEWTNQKLIVNDMANYYAYLPAAIIYKDLTFKFEDSLPRNLQSKIPASYLPEKDNKVLKMPVGVAILHSPFFLLGHVIAILTEADADGYSFPYQAALFFSNLFYTLLGLIFLRRLLLHYFSDSIALLVLLIIGLGTNLYYYTAYHPGMSHPYSFFALTAFTYYTIQWHNNPGIRYSLLIGLLAGITAILRPINTLIVLVFIFYDVYNLKTAKNKVVFFIKKYKYILLIIFISVIAVSPQFIYWKTITGNWIYYSYRNEGFFFHDPEIIKGLFDFRKGWLIYTPLMVFSLLGMFLLRKIKSFVVSIPLTFITSIYIIFSWWVWWYGGGFSCRSIIDYYGLLSIPLALFLEWVFSQKKLVKVSFTTVIILLICLNVWQSYQYNKGILHYDGMTKESYLRLFFAKHYTKNYRRIIDRPDYEMMKKNIEVSESDYEKQLTGNDLKFYRYCTVNFEVKQSIRTDKILPGESVYSKLLIIIKNKEKYPEYYELVKQNAKKNIERKVRRMKKTMSNLKEKAKKNNTSVDEQVQKHVDFIFNKKYRTIQ